MQVDTWMASWLSAQSDAMHVHLLLQVLVGGLALASADARFLSATPAVYVLIPRLQTPRDRTITESGHSRIQWLAESMHSSNLYPPRLRTMHTSAIYWRWGRDCPSGEIASSRPVLITVKSTYTHLDCGELSFTCCHPPADSAFMSDSLLQRREWNFHKVTITHILCCVRSINFCANKN